MGTHIHGAGHGVGERVVMRGALGVPMGQLWDPQAR